MFGISIVYLTWFSMPLGLESPQPGPAGWSSLNLRPENVLKKRLVTICKLHITYGLNIRIYPYIHFVGAILYIQ